MEMTEFSIPGQVFWRSKRVLLTGHTGFKGAWLGLWLERLGAEVTGLGLQPATAPSLFQLALTEGRSDSRICDIRDPEAVAAMVKQARPEVVFHLAAQALVRPGYRDPLATFATNIQGTANVLNALRPCDGVRAVVAVTTDKVYRNNEWAYPYREDDALGGHDPYSASKAASEIVISCMRDSFLAERGVAVASARAGNVIGGGDWSEDRLIPDAVRSWQQDRPVHVRRPQATRPWQHVLDPLAGYLTLAEKIWHKPELAGSYNFGPESQSVATVREVLELAQRSYGKATVVWGDGTEGPHEAGWLALEVAKARTIGVRPRWALSDAVQRTMNWYRQQQDGANARTLCDADFAAFEANSA
jgi:CDP-glucose 4,6-dehydratase